MVPFHCVPLMKKTLSWILEQGVRFGENGRVGGTHIEDMDLRCCMPYEFFYFLLIFVGFLIAQLRILRQVQTYLQFAQVYFALGISK